MQAGVPSKVCPQCGQLMPIDAAHCAYCGHAFRTQFAPSGVPAMPQYGAPAHYPAQPKNTGLKWFIALLVLGCMAAGIFLVVRMKYPAEPGSSATPTANHEIVPTSILNKDALSSPSKITIHWEKPQGDVTQGEVSNQSPEMLPNLYVQFLVDDGANGSWMGPYQIQYQPPGQQAQDAIPPNAMVPFTVPVAFAKIQRLHAYFVDHTPAGDVQYAVSVDQSQDRS